MYNNFINPVTGNHNCNSLATLIQNEFRILSNTMQQQLQSGFNDINRQLEQMSESIDSCGEGIEAINASLEEISGNNSRFNNGEPMSESEEEESGDIKSRRVSFSGGEDTRFTRVTEINSGGNVPSGFIPFGQFNFNSTGGTSQVGSEILQLQEQPKK